MEEGKGRQRVSNICRLLVVVWYSMHCMIGAQIVCCKDSGVCMFIVHWVFSSTSSLWFSLLDSPDKHLRPRTLLQSFPLISLSETEANRPLKFICLARDVDETTVSQQELIYGELWLTYLSGSQNLMRGEMFVFYHHVVTRVFPVRKNFRTHHTYIELLSTIWCK